MQSPFPNRVFRAGAALALFRTRHAGPALAAAGAAWLAIIAAESFAAELALSPLADTLARLALVGGLVACSTVTLADTLFPRLRQKLGSRRLFNGALMLGVGAALAQATLDPPLGVLQGTAVLSSGLVATCTGALAAWLCMLARHYPRDPKQAPHRNGPSARALGAALIGSAVFVAFALALQADARFPGPDHRAEVASDIAMHQGILKQGLSQLTPLRTSTSRAQQLPSASELRDAAADANHQYRHLANLVGLLSGGGVGLSPQAAAAYGKAAVAATALAGSVDGIGESQQPGPDSVSKVYTRGTQLLAAVDETLSVLDHDLDTDLERAWTNRLISAWAPPLALLFLALVVITPSVRSYGRQQSNARQARRETRAIDARMTAFRETLDKHCAITITGLDGRIIDANSRFSELTGYSRTELVGNSYDTLNSGALPQDYLSDMWDVVLSGKTWRGEFCDRTKDGSLVWVESIVSPQRDASGLINGCITISTDVTAIRGQSVTLQAMIDNFPGGIVLVDKAQRIVRCNAVYRELLDLPDSLFAESETPFERILRHRALRGDYGPADVDESVNLRLQRLRNPVPHVYERSDHKGRTLEVRSVPISGGGQLMTYLDVTERRDAEVALKSAHGRLEAFIKHAPAAVAMFDMEMKYLAHSDRWLQDYNIIGQSLIGRSHYDVFPEVPDHWKAKHQRVLRGATESSPEDRFLRADGTEQFLRWEVRPWYLDDNKIGGMMMLTEEITQRKKMEDQLWRLAKLDSLTGLPNRLLFNERLAGMISAAELTGEQFAVGLIDLDRFKEINDILGHDAGDALLRDVGSRLQSTLGNRGTVSRLGGDEFAFLISCNSGASALTQPIEAMFAAMEEPVELGGVPRKCGMSMGVTMYPNDSTKPRDLLKNADLALYRAKALGRDRCEFFVREMRTSIEKSYQLHNEVREALTSDALFLVYQPIVTLDKSRPVSFEALLRWRHPERGLLAPGAFDEVFSDPKVATEIGKRVIDIALKQAAAWQQEGLEFGRIAINATSADFALGGFAERLEQKLSAYNVAPEKLCIEVTESVFLGRGAIGVADVLDKLHALGVEIAFDDFGTGFASLSHIKAFPIGRLKIDRSFVCDMEVNDDNLSIVHAIVQLARSLEIAITAEGVENENQLTLLRSMGCQCIQGYFFSKPLEPAQVIEFVNRHRRITTRVA